MSPLSRMRKSRDIWKMKNSLKRKKVNRLIRHLASCKIKLRQRDAEIERLNSLVKTDSNSENSTPPSIDEIRERLKKLEEDAKRDREDLRRLEDENRKQQEEIERLEKELGSKKACATHAQEAQSAQVLCVYLVITCGVSFRSISKILRALMNLGVLRGLWVPHFTSIINWTLRLGIYLLNQVKPIDEPWIAIMDTSIDLGTRKAIVILRVRLAALQERGKAITLKDCQVIFLKILGSNCTGEVIEDCLETAFKASGRPIAILKDGGSDLKKGVLTYREKNKCKATLGVISDLGHFIANALKAEFGKSIGLKRLLTLVYGGAKRLRQTNAAIFVPPKLRTKGRFQGISRLAEWATWILDLMAVQGQVKDDSIVATLRKGFPKLPRLRAFIEKFAMTCKVMNELQEVLKNKGLNQHTYQASLLILQQLPESSHTRQQVHVWLNRHLGIQCRMGISQTPLLVSSDVIESLMGKLKSVLGRSSIGELNRMALVLPTLCGELTPEDIAIALGQTPHVDLLKTEKDVIPITLLQQRRRAQHFLNLREEVPKTSPTRLAG